MLAGSSLPEWDYEWDYTKGLPGNNGWTKSTSGTVTEELRDTDVRIGVAKSSSYFRYIWSTGNSKAVFEAAFTMTSNNNYNFMSVGNGIDERMRVRIQYSANYKGIYIANADAIGGMTKLATLALNTEYVFRLVLDSGYGSVYLNGNTLVENHDISDIYNADGSIFYPYIQFGSASTSSTKYYRNLHSMKLKIGRT